MMSRVERPPSKSFCGVSASVDKRIEARYTHVRARKFSCVNHISHLVAARFNSGRPPLKRSLSLPDCKELLKINSSAQMTRETQNNSKELTRARSVSFQPEIVLFAAVVDNDTETLRNLINMGKVDINQKSPSGLTALHYAAAEGSCECLRVLLEYGAHVNTVDSEDCSPLDFAVRGGHFDCAALLIQSGAEINRIVHGVNIR